MAEKILIFGATGAVGSSLAKQLQNNSINIHLIGKNKDELSKLSEETSASFSVADVTDPNFIENIDKDLKDTNIAGISYCCLLYTSPSPRDGLLSRMPSSA